MATEMITTVWPEWRVEQTLGKGSYGTVYKAVRNDSNLCSYAAIKVISIPTDPSELASLRSEGLTEEGTRTYFQGIVNDFVSEIRLMEALKGTQNIVSVEDYKVLFGKIASGEMEISNEQVPVPESTANMTVTYVE